MSSIAKYAGSKVANALVNKALNAISSKYKGKSFRKQNVPVAKMKLYKKIMNGTVHLFKQKVVLVTNVATSATGYNFFARQFALSDLPNSSEYTSLFDSYKFHKIKYQLMSTHQSSNEAGTTNPNDLFGGAVIDPDDVSVVGWVDFSDISQYNDWKPRKVTNSRGIKKYFTPTVNNQIQATVNATYLATQYKPLLDMASPGIPHLGVKVGLLGTASTTYQIYETITYYLECRTKR